MIKRLASAVLALLAVALGLITVGQATAVGVQPESLAVEQVFTSADPSVDDTFSYVITAQDPDNPLPVEAENGSYVFSITGDATHLLEPVSFSEPGIYEYRLSQVIRPHDGHGQDETVYWIEVVVSATSGVAPQVVIHRGHAAGAKVESVIFNNVYPAEDESGAPEATGHGTTGAPSSSGVSAATGGQGIADRRPGWLAAVIVVLLASGGLALVDWRRGVINRH
ncbi:MAG: hypothetical protein LBV30_02745 [Propionibacteriaceae bacterium]|jgi:hypothetical protein|nr:hypothetical protein [Propionibacteriaceae bacterium]